MRIRVVGFKHPDSDKSVVYREVKKLETLFNLMRKAVEEHDANLFSIRIIKDKEKELSS